MPGDAVVAVSGLRKRYGAVPALEDVSFTVVRGEIFGVIGPNGAGKTTAMECLQGLRRADGGELRVLGLDPATEGDRLRRRIGCQLQESGLPDRIRVWEALDLFTPSGEDWRPLLADWGLKGKRNAMFGSLSGGQRQRLFVALALVARPELVFLDEMTTGLDPGARRVAWNLIAAIRDRGATVILVTHAMEEAERLCDRIAVLVAGRVAATGTPAGLALAHGGPTTLTFGADGIPLEWIPGVPGVRSVARRGDRVVVEGGGALIPMVAAGLVSRGHVPEDLTVRQPTLEDAYMALTGAGTEGP